MRILVWFRKDLRLDDHTALDEAVRDADGDVVPFYTSEPSRLARDDIAPTRVRFVLESLADLAAAIERRGSHLALDHGEADVTVPRAALAARVDAVYWNDEYEPSQRARDDTVERALQNRGIATRRFHDRLLAPPGAVTTREGRPFVVFTPFERAASRLPSPRPRPAPPRLASHDLPVRPIATLDRLGFPEPGSTRWPGGAVAARARLDRFIRDGLASYATHRDQPAADTGSRLSADLGFGTLSVRAVHAAVRAAAADDPRLEASARKFTSELRWRDFYAHVLFHFPHVEHGAFRRDADTLEWAGDPAHFDLWAAGRTGYPLVDAGMRELAATGRMHNRVRMVVASFLAKDLLLDWRLGERHFMRHLVDGDLASNNGGWQWAASSGTDPQPWFRIFNPTLQGERFDPDGAYVRRWVPELAGVPGRFIHRPHETPGGAGDYPHPIVEHAPQRERALAMYGAALKPSGGIRADPN
jgi:deoxyribodipyrimidine photo-lyase